MFSYFGICGGKRARLTPNWELLTGHVWCQGWLCPFAACHFPLGWIYFGHRGPAQNEPLSLRCKLPDWNPAIGLSLERPKREEGMGNRERRQGFLYMWLLYLWKNVGSLHIIKEISCLILYFQEEEIEIPLQKLNGLVQGQSKISIWKLIHFLV